MRQERPAVVSTEEAVWSGYCHFLCTHALVNMPTHLYSRPNLFFSRPTMIIMQQLLLKTKLSWAMCSK